MIRKKKSSRNIRKIDELNTAIAINDTETIHELLINDIDMNCGDSHGAYPIMFAVEYGNANALISLLRHGTNPNVIDKRNGYTPLMKALSGKYISNRYLIVMLLLKNGADVNIISNHNKTALYLAKAHNPRYVNLLKRFGAEF